MSDFLEVIGDNLSALLSFFISVALLQNIVLTAGFGTSMMLHVVRTPKTIWLFGGIMTGFSVLTTVIAYPLDVWLGAATTNFFRPLIIVCITGILYIGCYFLLQKKAPTLYARVGRMLPLAAFNNLVVGVALLGYTHFPANLGGIIGLSVGACLGFTLLTWLTAEGIERLDNPDMPDAFRGTPATLIYIGILALALMGFTSDFSFLG